MSIVLMNGKNQQLIAVDTEQHADYQYTKDDNTSWRDEPVAKLVASYKFVTNPDHPSFTGTAGNVGSVIDSITVSENGDIYGTATSKAFSENGVKYPDGEYLVKLVSAGPAVQNPDSGVYEVPYQVEPVVNDDGLYIKGYPAQRNSVSFIDVEGKEFLIASNSLGDAYATAKESTNLLIDTETGKSTSIMLDNNGDGTGDKPFDVSPVPYSNANFLPTTGSYDFNDLEVIQDPETGQYYALVMTIYGTSSYVDRYDVRFDSNPSDPSAPPVMTIDTTSKALIMELYSNYSGFSVNDDGSVDFLPSGTANDYGMITVQRLKVGDTVYDTFVDFAVDQQGNTRRVIQPSRDDDLSYRIRLADHSVPDGADAAPSQRLYGSEGGLPGTPMVNYPAASGSTVPCFTEGTLIRTPDGDKYVQDLVAGDLVVILNGDPLPVRWVGRRHLDMNDLIRNPKLRPVRICAGALGNGLPSRDLLVSPQHRMLIRSKIATRIFSTSEVLIAAKHLLGCQGVEIAEDVAFVTYVHFMCDNHAVVLAEGAPSETLLLGPMARNSVGPAALEEIYTLFPELRDRIEIQPARKVASGRQGRKLAFRHAKNNAALSTAE